MTDFVKLYDSIPETGTRCSSVCDGRCCPRAPAHAWRPFRSTVIIFVPGEVEHLVSQGLGWPTQKTAAGVEYSEECPYFKEGFCTVYKNRPLDCRTYPVLPGGGFSRTRVDMACPDYHKVEDLTKAHIGSLWVSLGLQAEWWQSVREDIDDGRPAQRQGDFLELKDTSGDHYLPLLTLSGTFDHSKDMPAASSLERMAELTDSHRWHFAKTMPENPHWYTLRREWADQGAFNELVLYIRQCGYQKEYKGNMYTCLNVGEYYYWTMGAALEETILINRAKLRREEDEAIAA